MNYYERWSTTADCVSREWVNALISSVSTQCFECTGYGISDYFIQEPCESREKYCNRCHVDYYRNETQNGSYDNIVHCSRSNKKHEAETSYESCNDS